MGDSRKQRKKYQTPSHPWQAARIEKEKVLVKNYGLKKKKEIWKMDFVLKKMKRQAKQLLSRQDEQGKKETTLLLEKGYTLGLLEQNAELENILDLNIEQILERRLQTQLVNKKLARTANQARQFIVHQHVMVGEKKVDSPSYLVKRKEETNIQFSPDAKLANAEHPERVIEEKKEKLKGKAITPKKKEVSKVDTTKVKVEKEETKEEVKKESAPVPPKEEPKVEEKQEVKKDETKPSN